MTRVRADLNLSLDGFGSTSDQTDEHPFGHDWGKIVGAYTATRTMQQRVFGDTTGSGTTGIDEKHAAAYFEGLGAEIMGAAMFGLHLHPNDPEWRGWWGEEPPFHVPVFVLTHERREPLEMAGGTTFTFLAAEPEDVLARAVEAAAGKDVRIGGGVRTVREFLRRGLVDELHVALTPVLLGAGPGGTGERLWDELRGLEEAYEARSEVAESGTIHTVFTRRRA